MGTDAVIFANMPCFDHIKLESDRQIAATQHRMFERELETQHEGVLHEAVMSPQNTLRQQLAFLIQKYCQKNRMSLPSLSDAICRANGDIYQPNLYTNTAPNKTIVNLHVLDDATLRRLYLQIPGEQRVTAPRPDKSKKRKGRPESKENEFRFQWVCCDNCSKWRRIPEDLAVPEHWSCSMHPRGITCEEPEDQMAEDETVS